MPNIDFIKNYTNSIIQFRDTWVRVMPWMMIWLLAFVVPIQAYISRKQMFYFDLDAGELLGGTLSYGLIGVLLYVLISAFALYSMFGVVYQTDDDNYANWLTCGVQGFVHPIRSFVCALIFQGITLVCWIAAEFTLDFLQDAGIGTAAVSALFVLVWFFLVVNFVMIWFKSMDEPEISALDLIKESVKSIHGHRRKTILLMIPVLFLSWICGSGAFSCYAHYTESDRIERAFAEETLKHAKQMAASEREFVDKLNRAAYNQRDLLDNDFILSREVFRKEMPEYDGDFKAYVHAMAEYGYQREVFEARRDRRDISFLAQAYYNRPTKVKSWTVGIFFCGLAGSITLAFALILLLQIYRGLEEASVYKKTEPDEKDEQKLVTSNRSRHEAASKEPSGLILSNAPVERAVEVDKSPDLPSGLLSALRFVESEEAVDEHVSMPNASESAQTSTAVSTSFGAALENEVMEQDGGISPFVMEEQQESPVFGQDEHEAQEAMSEAILAEKKLEIRAWRDKLVASNKKALNGGNVPVLSGQSLYEPVSNASDSAELSSPFQMNIRNVNVYQNRNPVDFSGHSYEESEPKLHPIYSDDDSTPVPRSISAFNNHEEYDRDYQRKKTVCVSDLNIR